MSEYKVPGVVIHHSPASTKKYVGCPSICILNNGIYVASHSYFGPGSSDSVTYVYQSADKGLHWEPIAEIQDQIWSNLFVHNGVLYIMGTDHCDNRGGRLNGRIVIRRSDDGGRSWSHTGDSGSGLLSDHDGFHTAPVPVISHAGRLWRTMEYAPHPSRITWRTLMMSVPENADLLERSNWVFSEMMEHSWSRSQWIEGNALVDRNGNVVNLLRTNYHGDQRIDAAGFIDRAVLVHVSEDGKHLVHNPDQHTVNMPGGGTKFTVRYDSESDLYWTLVNKQLDPEARRNRLYLASSRDLYRWTTERLLLEHPDSDFHAFQYVDWVFEGQDILYVSRTAYDDDDGGPHNYHDNNYMTFHRIKSFRENVSTGVYK